MLSIRALALDISSATEACKVLICAFKSPICLRRGSICVSAFVWAVVMFLVIVLRSAVCVSLRLAASCSSLKNDLFDLRMLFTALSN